MFDQINAYHPAIHFADIRSSTINTGSLQATLPDDFFRQLDERQDQLVEFADSAHLAIELHERLSQLDAIGLLKTENRTLLEARVWEGEARHADALLQITEIASAFTMANINFVFLKSAALIAGGCVTVPCQRFHVDIDLLVESGSLDNAVSELQKIGYESDIILPNSLSEHWVSKHIPPMHHRDRRFRIDLHHKPLDSTLLDVAPLSTEKIMRQKEPHQINGEIVWIPTRAHLLLCTFYHSQVFDGYEMCRINNYRSYLDVALLSLADQTTNRPVEEARNILEIDPATRKMLTRFDRFIKKASLAMGINRSRDTDEFAKLLNLGYKDTSILAYARKTIHFSLQQLNEAIKQLSHHGRRERALLLKHNPDVLKYKPVIQQILHPRILKYRINYLISRIVS